MKGTPFRFKQKLSPEASAAKARRDTLAAKTPIRRFKKAGSMDELLNLLNEYPDLKRKVKNIESLSLEELKEAIAHGIVELIYEEKEERIKKLK
jgi:2-oxo-4-hydroxy-4-carboxy--5-ureidoimidazoline (OHCU) decarboxylase